MLGAIPNAQRSALVNLGDLTVYDTSKVNPISSYNPIYSQWEFPTCIRGQSFFFWQKIWMLDKILNFWQNLVFWTKFWIFNKNLNFSQKFGLLIKGEGWSLGLRNPMVVFFMDKDFFWIKICKKCFLHVIEQEI